MNTTQQTETILHTMDEAAALLRINRTTLWRLRKSGDLSTVTIAGRSLIRRDELLSYIDSQTKRG